MITLDSIREKLRLLDDKLPPGGEDWPSLRKRADEIVLKSVEAAKNSAESNKERFWLCALQASDLSKNIAISNLSFSGGLDKAAYSLPPIPGGTGGILKRRQTEHRSRAKSSSPWRKTWISDPRFTMPVMSSVNSVGKRLSSAESEFKKPPEYVDWKNLLVLSFHLLGDDLLIFCVDNLNPFLIGYLDDYAFREERLPQDYRLAFEPIVIPGFFKKIALPIQDMQASIDMLSDHEHAWDRYEYIQKNFRAALGMLGMYFELGTILGKLNEVGIDSKQRILLIIPDKTLNQVPIHLLYTLSNEPLYNQFAGVAYSWDLLSFKWRHYRRYIYYNRRFGRAKCIFFAVPGDASNENYLSGTSKELKLLQKFFGEDSAVVFGNKGPEEFRSIADNFIAYHRDAELLVFSGHGHDFRMNVLFPSRLHGPRDQDKIPIPCFGLVFEDRIVSSAEIVGSDCWNFSRSRLILLNSCLLATLAGPETTHGIRTALYAKGATSVIGSLWPVYDDLCPEFIEAFSNPYCEFLKKEESFVLAKSLNIALQKLEKYTKQKYGVDMSILYGGYILDGIP